MDAKEGRMTISKSSKVTHISTVLPARRGYTGMSDSDMERSGKRQRVIDQGARAIYASPFHHIVMRNDSAHTPTLVLLSQPI